MLDVWFCWATPQVMSWVRVDAQVGFHFGSVSGAHFFTGLSVRWALICELLDRRQDLGWVQFKGVKGAEKRQNKDEELEPQIHEVGKDTY